MTTRFPRAGTIIGSGHCEGTRRPCRRRSHEFVRERYGMTPSQRPALPPSRGTRRSCSRTGVGESTMTTTWLVAPARATPTAPGTPRVRGGAEQGDRNRASGRCLFGRVVQAADLCRCSRRDALPPGVADDRNAGFSPGRRAQQVSRVAAQQPTAADTSSSSDDSHSFPLCRAQQLTAGDLQRPYSNPAGRERSRFASSFTDHSKKRLCAKRVDSRCCRGAG